MQLMYWRLLECLIWEFISLSDLFHRGFSTATKAGATASALPGCARLRGAGI